MFTSYNHHLISLHSSNTINDSLTTN